MDSQLINHYAHQLHWNLPEELQQEAIEWLIENTPDNQLPFIFPPYTKSCWQNAMKVIEAISYPNNETALPRIIELFKDLNWPGAEEAVQYFQTLDAAIVAPFMEAAARRAKTESDSQWLWFLYAVCERLYITASHFQDQAVFEAMKAHYDND